jgi:hypothetical protein
MTLPKGSDKIAEPQRFRFNAKKTALFPIYVTKEVVTRRYTIDEIAFPGLTPKRRYRVRHHSVVELE